MSWLHKTMSKYGRLVNKPQQIGKQEEITEEAVTIQDQIENLRTKIVLKERYNKALQDDLIESHQGTAFILEDLNKTTKDLRQALVDAIISEKSAVQNALRTNREFQLALNNRTAGVSVSWLDDKLFDMSKLLNNLLDRLKAKRGKLEESEQLVLQIEKCPRPGSLQWEMEAMSAFNTLECLIEGQKVKRETACILNAKYLNIKIILDEEKGKYASTLQNMETGFQSLKKELDDLQKMLQDAMHFRDEAYKNLLLTEKEASDNRKQRRKQMSKMKRAVDRILEENQNISHKPKIAATLGTTGSAGNIRTNEQDSLVRTPSATDLERHLRMKREEVAEYQDRAQRLVDIMRVPDLTHIPTRLHTVAAVGQRLVEEKQMKENLRDSYLKQQFHLTLLIQHHRYTGGQQREEFLSLTKEYENASREVQKRKTNLQNILDHYGSITSELRLGLIALHERINENRGKVYHSSHGNMLSQMKTILEKTKRLVKAKADLEAKFEGKITERNYDLYVKNPPLRSRLIRIGTPAVSEESEAEDDLTDAKVPGRAEIKAKSLRIVNQSLLTKGPASLV